MFRHVVITLVCVLTVSTAHAQFGRRVPPPPQRADTAGVTVPCERDHEPESASNNGIAVLVIAGVLYGAYRLSLRRNP